MPLGEIAGEALGSVFRFAAHIMFEIVVEWLLRGTGALIQRLIRPRHEPGEKTAIVIGLLFWIAMVALGFWLYRQASP